MPKQAWFSTIFIIFVTHYVVLWRAAESRGGVASQEIRKKNNTKHYMGFNDFLKSLFGSKSDRDLKKLRPILQKIKDVYPSVEALSNDELRARVTAIRQEIQDCVQPLRDEIAKIKVEVEELDFDKRQPLWDKVDKLQKEVLDRIQEKLDEVLPEVYAIVKDTARRFAQNETIVVKATDFDRKLAAEGRDFLTIDGDTATYYNHWVAGGNEVTWDMVHYDVQLIGGIVLHQGKIAEMARHRPKEQGSRCLDGCPQR